MDQNKPILFTELERSDSNFHSKELPRIDFNKKDMEIELPLPNKELSIKNSQNTCFSFEDLLKSKSKEVCSLLFRSKSSEESVEKIFDKLAMIFSPQQVSISRLFG